LYITADKVHRMRKVEKIGNNIVIHDPKPPIGKLLYHFESLKGYLESMVENFPKQCPKCNSDVFNLQFHESNFMGHAIYVVCKCGYVLDITPYEWY
jgi:hypothetical protein